MSMVIAVKNGNSIIMTADKRITTTNIHGDIINFRDDYEKNVIIANKFILSFVGRTLILECTLEYINTNLPILDDATNYENEVLFFKNAFLYGKEKFIEQLPGLEPMSIFFLGTLKNNNATLVGFSSDNNFAGAEYEAAIKVNANNRLEEDQLILETQEFIGSEIAKTNGQIESYKELAEIYFSAIKRVEDLMVGDTGTTLVLTTMGIEEYEHF